MRYATVVATVFLLIQSTNVADAQSRLYVTASTVISPTGVSCYFSNNNNADLRVKSYSITRFEKGPFGGVGRAVQRTEHACQGNCVVKAGSFIIIPHNVRSTQNLFHWNCQFESGSIAQRDAVPKEQPKPRRNPPTGPTVEQPKKSPSEEPSVPQIEAEAPPLNPESAPRSKACDDFPLYCEN